VTQLSLTINGRPYGPVEVRDELSMNDFLREYLGLTGTKFGCGRAQCLSCAVIVDDPDGTSRTSPTCVVPAVTFAGRSIRTIESHARDGQLSALQKAFVEHFAFQCGYCTPGFVLMATQLLEAHPEPDEDQIRHYLSGNLCRCAAYPEIVNAVKIAARKHKAGSRV
jgi:aerobic-type carbon monoxide dehydrogenase small subunit (CoxS/CutS family)